MSLMRTFFLFLLCAGLAAVDGSASDDKAASEWKCSPYNKTRGGTRIGTSEVIAIVHPKQCHGEKSCPHLTTTKKCFTKKCPVNCKQSEFECGKCNKYTGYRTCTRKTLIYPNELGRPCGPSSIKNRCDVDFEMSPEIYGRFNNSDGYGVQWGKGKVILHPARKISKISFTNTNYTTTVNYEQSEFECSKKTGFRTWNRKTLIGMENLFFMEGKSWVNLIAYERVLSSIFEQSLGDYVTYMFSLIAKICKRVFYYTIIVAFGVEMVYLLALIPSYFIINSRQPNKRLPFVDRMKPKAIDFRHMINTIFYRQWDWWLQFLSTIIYCGKLYFFPQFGKRVTNRMVFDFIMETTISMYLKPADSEIWELEIDMKSFVNGEIVRIFARLNIQTREVVMFRVNQKSVTNPCTMLLHLTIAYAIAIHPACHTLFDKLYSQREKTGKRFDRIFWNGQQMNESANFLPFIIFGMSPHHGNLIIDYNIKHNPLSVRHEHVNELAKHSRFLRFCLNARSHLKNLVKKHKVNVNLTDFFVSSIVHSLDHYCGYQIINNVRFDEGIEKMHLKVKNRWFCIHAFVKAFVIGPESEFFCSNKLKDAILEDIFYLHLYKALQKDDAELADQVDLSISR